MVAELGVPLRTSRYIESKKSKRGDNFKQETSFDHHNEFRGPQCAQNPGRRIQLFPAHEMHKQREG